MPDQPFYAESPFERVVDVHWKKKKPGGGGEPPGGFKCGSYGYGAKTELVGHLVSDVPYGPNIFEPFVGPLHDAQGNVVGEAAPYGQAAQGLTLNEGVISFTTPQLRDMAFTIPTMTPNFFAGLIAGYETLGFTFDLAWFSRENNPVAQYGLDFITSGAALPPIPSIMMGGTHEGTFNYSYDFKLKGPALVFWRRNLYPVRPDLWTFDASFVAHNLFIDDWYTWQITAICGDKLPQYQ